MLFELPTSIKSDSERLARIPELKELAAAGDVKARIELAWELAEGEIIDADFVTAAQLFESAAASGDPDAQLNLARFLHLRHVPSGTRAIRKFAREGNAKAQLWLGLIYRSRPGRINQLRAAVWFKRANQNGSVSGAIALDGQRMRFAPMLIRPMLIFIMCCRWLWKLMISSEFNNYDTDAEFNHTFTRLKRR